MPKICLNIDKAEKITKCNVIPNSKFCKENKSLEFKLT